MRSVTAGEPLTIRSPHSTRPWQHVLDCLSGYLVLGQRLLAGDITCADAWNFGPDGDGNRTVEKVLSAVVRTLPQVRWQLASGTQPHEAGLLQLDSSKAKMQLGWRPVWNLDNAIDHTATWYLRFLETGEVSSIDELAAYVADAGNSGLDWATT